MMKLNTDFVDRFVDDAIMLDVCAAALLVEEGCDRTRLNVSRLLESIAERMGATIDMLDAIVDRGNAVSAHPAADAANIIAIGDEMLSLKDRLAARRRSVDSGEN